MNCLSPGPANTLAARGLPGFRGLLSAAAERAPLRRGVEHAEVGSAAVFLASDGAAAVTGQTLSVDCGASAVAAG